MNFERIEFFSKTYCNTILYKKKILCISKDPILRIKILQNFYKIPLNETSSECLFNRMPDAEDTKLTWFVFTLCLFCHFCSFSGINVSAHAF
jgi:hypothetical protein